MRSTPCGIYSTTNQDPCEIPAPLHLTLRRRCAETLCVKGSQSSLWIGAASPTVPAPAVRLGVWRVACGVCYPPRNASLATAAHALSFQDALRGRVVASTACTRQPPGSNPGARDVFMPRTCLLFYLVRGCKTGGGGGGTVEQRTIFPVIGEDTF